MMMMRPFVDQELTIMTSMPVGLAMMRLRFSDDVKNPVHVAIVHDALWAVPT
jgi:hypothetical protein